MRVVCIADKRFADRALNLRRSLDTSGNDYQLTVYCDGDPLFEAVASPRCTLKPWERVKRLGAKRAKLSAWADAVQQGPFVHLDADAIVLGSLEGYAHESAIVGVPDDLSQCGFIEDPKHPWPNFTELENHRYVCTANLFFPAQARAWLAEAARLADDDAEWQRRIFPGALNDNHFFCAQLNERPFPLHPADERVYGWQGLLRWHALQVVRQGDRLVNAKTGEELKVAIFAGAQQTADLLLSFPLEVSSLLCARTQGPPPPRAALFSQLLAQLSPALAQPLPDPHTRVVGQVLLQETSRVLTRLAEPQHAEPTYFKDAMALRAVAFATTNPEAEWNGLRCGQAYLEGREYNQLRELVRSLGIRSVLESGAGESSIFFRRLGVDTWSVESQEGPWAQRAREQGCRVLLVPFDDASRRFDERTLRVSLAGLKEVDLVFVDSPVGTERRRWVLSQLLERVKARFVLFHDALRDSVNVYADEQAHGLRMVQSFDSPRGMLLYEVGTPPRPPPVKPLSKEVVVAEPKAKLRVVDAPKTLRAGARAVLKVELTNEGADPWSSDFARQVHLSYHWWKGDAVHAWDGLRTRLPHAVYPGDVCRCPLDVEAPKEPGRYRLGVTLVQEEVCWFHEVFEESIATLELDVG